MDLLKEVREDVKALPSKEDVEDLEKRITRLENNFVPMLVKVGIAAGLLSLVSEFIIRFMFRS